MIESEVNANEWKLELEHVAPQLVLRLAVDHKEWRTHVEAMHEQKKEIEGMQQASVSELRKVAEEIGKVCDRIQKREKMLASDSSISSMVTTMLHFTF